MHIHHCNFAGKCRFTIAGVPDVIVEAICHYGGHFIILGVSQVREVGAHEQFNLEVKFEIDWDRIPAGGFTFPMQKKTVSR